MSNRKYILSFVILSLLAINIPVFAVAGQWSSTGTTIYYNDGNVGIGTNSPNNKLDVKGDLTIGRNGGSVLYVQTPSSDVRLFTNGSNLTIPTGNVGIGTTTPSAKLDIAQSIGDVIRIRSTNDSSRYIWNIPSSGERLELSTVDGTNSQTHSGVIKIIRNGDVYMGHNDDPVTLSVNGVIKTKQVIVTNSDWADYVFEDSYKLISLNDVEQYIKENKHLPNIPSAKEIEEKGISIGEIQKKQMEKIEELTLYIIEQNHLIKELESRIDKFIERSN